MATVLTACIYPTCPISPAWTTDGMLADADQSQLPEAWSLERRSDGAVLVRVPPRRQQVPPLPDAVFTFREGDPQFDFWHGQLAQQETQQR